MRESAMPLNFLRLVVFLEVGTIAAIVFTAKQETTVQCGCCNCSEDEKRKYSSEKSRHNQIYNNVLYCQMRLTDPLRFITLT